MSESKHFFSPLVLLSLPLLVFFWRLARLKESTLTSAASFDKSRRRGEEIKKDIFLFQKLSHLRVSLLLLQINLLGFCLVNFSVEELSKVYFVRILVSFKYDDQFWKATAAKILVSVKPAAVWHLDLHWKRVEKKQQYNFAALNLFLGGDLSGGTQRV